METTWRPELRAGNMLEAVLKGCKCRCCCSGGKASRNMMGMHAASACICSQCVYSRAASEAAGLKEQAATATTGELRLVCSLQCFIRMLTGRQLVMLTAGMPCRLTELSAQLWNAHMVRLTAIPPRIWACKQRELLGHCSYAGSLRADDCPLVYNRRAQISACQ